MSERGSFCTEYLYCGKCAQALKIIFDKENKHEGDKYFKPEYLYVVPNYNEEPRFHIIAGKVGGLYAGEEISVFLSLKRDIEEVICCPVDIAVMSDDCDARRILKMIPKKESNGN